MNERGANRFVEVRVAPLIHNPGKHLPIGAFPTGFVLRLVTSTPLIGRSRSQRAHSIVLHEPLHACVGEHGAGGSGRRKRSTPSRLVGTLVERWSDL